MKIYLANSLFSESDRLYNAKVAKELRKISGVEVYVPQENEAINDKNNCATSEEIAMADVLKLEECSVLVAVLDGAVIDAGVASEIGYAYGRGILTIGLLTDVRQQGGENKLKLNLLEEVAENQFNYVNLFTTGLIKMNGTIVTSVDELVNYVARSFKFMN